MMVTLLAEVANDYLQIRGLQERLHIAEENLKLQQDSLDLTRSLRHAGFNSELDVSREETQVSQTKSQIVPLRTQLVQVQHALAILLGDEPDALAVELEATAPVPTVPPLVTIGMPSDLLRRRPDIRRAERQIASANARVGAAIADFYPKFRPHRSLRSGCQPLPEPVRSRQPIFHHLSERELETARFRPHAGQGRHATGRVQAGHAELSKHDAGRTAGGWKTRRWRT